MEAHHKQALQRHLVVFMEDLDVDAGIIRHLQAAGVLNQMMVDEINAFESKTKRALALVQMLPKRGHKAFAMFVDALKRTGHEEVAERLIKDVNFNNSGKPVLTTSPVYFSRRHDTPRVSNPNQPIAPPSSPINTAEVTDDSDNDSIVPDHHFITKTYNMDKANLGSALIINNYRFTNTQLNRENGEKDATQLYHVLQNIGFKVLLRHNLTAKEMQSEMTAYCQCDRHDRSNSTLVAVLSHGTNTSIMGIDGAFFSTQALLNSICDVPALLNIPKLFIIDACTCQGEERPRTGRSRDSSAVSYRTSLSSANSSIFGKNHRRGHLTSAKSNRSNLRSANNTPARIGSAVSRHVQSISGFLNYINTPSEVTDDVFTEEKDVDFMSIVPPTTDIFIMRSTIDRPVPWENVVEGSVLVQCFARVLTNYHKNTDMFGLYKMTKELVSMKEYKAHDEDGRIITCKQSVDLVDRFKHVLFLRSKPVVRIPHAESELEVIDLDNCTTPREPGDGQAIKRTKHVQFENHAEVIKTDARGRVLNGRSPPIKRSKICVIL